jgi:hypothetical protein
LYDLGAKIHPLSEISQHTSLDEAYFALLIAEGALSAFLQMSVYRPRTCLQSGTELLEVIRPLREKAEEKSGQAIKITPLDAYRLQAAFTKFENIVSAELAIMPVYLIDQKGAYDTDRLVVSGELLFPVELSNKVPDSIEDIRQATKCLAFELPSACGFHLHRASEAILRIYFDSLTNSAPRPKSRNIGDYLNELDKLGVGDKQTKSALRDLKDLHRNPLIHPEHSIESTEAAIALLGSVQAAVTNMLKAIPIQPPPAPQLPQAGSGSSVPKQPRKKAKF